MPSVTVTVSDTMEIPETKWYRVQAYGTWNGATLDLVQNGVVYTDFDDVAADTQPFAVLLKQGTLTVTVTGTATAVIIEALPVIA